MHLNIFGLHFVKKIVLSDRFKNKDVGGYSNVLKCWFDDIKNFSTKIDFTFFINDNFDVCVKMKNKDCSTSIHYFESGNGFV